MTTSTTLTSKGQVTVPRDIRERLNLKTGDKLVFSVLSDGTLVARPKVRRVTDLAGLLYKADRAPVRLEDMRVELTDDSSPA